jgi:hypothetical protein
MIRTTLITLLALVALAFASSTVLASDIVVLCAGDPPVCTEAPEVPEPDDPLPELPGPSADEIVTEDDPRWDCETMGNRICGPTIIPDTAMAAP